MSNKNFDSSLPILPANSSLYNPQGAACFNKLMEQIDETKTKTVILQDNTYVFEYYNSDGQKLLTKSQVNGDLSQNSIYYKIENEKFEGFGYYGYSGFYDTDNNGVINDYADIYGQIVRDNDEDGKPDEFLASIDSMRKKQNMTSLANDNEISNTQVTIGLLSGIPIVGEPFKYLYALWYLK